MPPAHKPVSFSLPLFPYDRWGGIDAIGRIAVAADELGFGGLQFPDHVIMPLKPGAPPVSTVWYDNFVLAAHLATLTQRVRFIFNVLVVPYRPAVLLAKLVSTLDVVSRGRLTLGVGAGWIKGEFRILGVPFEERGALTDDTLRAMKVLWTEPDPKYEGTHTRFASLAFEPRCVQQPHVPIWVGGSGPGPLRRVVELGDGWSPMTGSLDELARDVAWIREQAQARGRDPDAFDFASGIAFGERDPERDRARSHAAGTDLTRGGSRPQSPQEILDQVARLREIGFGHLSVSFPWREPAEYLERMQWFAAELMPKLPTD